MIKIYCCDALYFLRPIDDSSVDMVLTDPMNTKDPEFNLKWLKESYRVLKGDKVLCSFCTPSTLDAFIEQVKSAGFTYLDTIYRENTITGEKEPCIVVYKGDLKFKVDLGYPNYVWETEGEVEGFPKEARKPLALIKQLVHDFTREGDLVIDFFLGSGTTALASKDLGRNFKGCERNVEFCNVAKKRLGFHDMFQTGI
jgi:DNA modification methylase